MRQRTGSIDTTRKGEHRVRLTVRGERRTLGIYPSQEEAETQRDAALEVIDAADVNDTWTVAEWGDRWLTAREISGAVRDPESDWSRFRIHIQKDPIAKLSLRSVRRRHVRDWLKRVRAKVARQTTLNTLNVLRGMLAAAVEDEIIKSNPAAGLRLPREKRTEDPWTYATVAEQHALVSALDSDERHIIGFAIGTGLRAGELVTLRLADVHVAGANPHVVVRYGKAPNLPTKAGRIREVPLFGMALEAAKAWLAVLPRWAKANPKGLMFPRLRGGFRDERHVLRWDVWQSAKTKAGITRPFRWHDLRHTAGSSLVSGWWGRKWSLDEVRDFLGHESVTTTERYAHLAGTALQKAAAETRHSATIGHEPAPADNQISQQFSSGVPGPGRTGGPRFRKSLDNPAISAGYEGRGQLVAISLAYLRAVAVGDDAAVAVLGAQLGAIYVSDPVRTIELAESIVAAAQAGAATEEVG